MARLTIKKTSTFRIDSWCLLFFQGGLNKSNIDLNFPKEITTELKCEPITNNKLEDTEQVEERNIEETETGIIIINPNILNLFVVIWFYSRHQ